MSFNRTCKIRFVDLPLLDISTLDGNNTRSQYTVAETPLGTNSNMKWQKLQWSTLLLSLVLLSATTITQQHIHTVDAPAENCVVCVHGDAPAVPADTAACLVEPPVLRLVTVDHTQPACQSAAVAYLTRAPPNA